MSIFGFGQGGFAALTQTLENIGNIVAPMNEEEKGHRDEDDDEEDETMDDRVQSFMSSFMANNNNNNNNDESDHAEGPDSPSMVSVDLDDSTHSASFNPSPSPKKIPGDAPGDSFALLSSPELERKVQQRYREQLEAEICKHEARYRELQEESDEQMELLRGECVRWQGEARSAQTSHQSPSSPPPSPPPDDELKALYGKLDLSARDLDAKNAEVGGLLDRVVALTVEAEAAREETRQLAAVKDAELAGLRERVAFAEEVEARSEAQANEAEAAGLREMRERVAALTEEAEQARAEAQVARAEMQAV
ncbi:hypothetical protein B484DRAFT_275859, partial [Ochromonadaceae sp. CCMP2298]